jgi:hypothetical protein
MGDRCARRWTEERNQIRLRGLSAAAHLPLFDCQPHLVALSNSAHRPLGGPVDGFEQTAYMGGMVHYAIFQTDHLVHAFPRQDLVAEPIVVVSVRNRSGRRASWAGG